MKGICHKSSIIGLFCRISSLLYGSCAKEIYRLFVSEWRKVESYIICQQSAMDRLWSICRITWYLYVMIICQKSPMFMCQKSPMFMCQKSAMDRLWSICRITWYVCQVYMSKELVYMSKELVIHTYLCITRALFIVYGVATVSRIDKNIDLFCRIASLL